MLHIIPSTALDLLCVNCWVLANDDKSPCAWCYPGSQGNSIGSHGICQTHSDEIIAEMRAEVTEHWITREGDWVEDVTAPIA